MLVPQARARLCAATTRSAWGGGATARGVVGTVGAVVGTAGAVVGTAGAVAGTAGAVVGARVACGGASMTRVLARVQAPVAVRCRACARFQESLCDGHYLEYVRVLAHGWR